MFSRGVLRVRASFKVAMVEDKMLLQIFIGIVADALFPLESVASTFTVNVSSFHHVVSLDMNLMTIEF